MSEIKAIRFWPDADAFPLTPFTVADYLTYRLPLEEGRRGVHIKKFVKDRDGRACVFTSGALGEARIASHTDEVENARRVAFPLHEALIPLLLRRCGILVNEVCLGFRNMSVAITGERVRLMVSVHEMQAATSRHDIPDLSRRRTSSRTSSSCRA